MSSNLKFGQSEETHFSFAVRELRQAKADAQNLSLAGPAPAPKPSIKETGSDPYNTSGSFDRKKHWTRVGRR
jgi:hypothetical protein